MFGASIAFFCNLLFIFTHLRLAVLAKLKKLLYICHIITNLQLEWFSYWKTIFSGDISPIFSSNRLVMLVDGNSQPLVLFEGFCNVMFTGKMRKRGCIVSKLLAKMMCKSGLTHVITMDLHQKEIQGFFDCPVDNLRASPFLLQYIQECVSMYIIIIKQKPG